MARMGIFTRLEDIAEHLRGVREQTLIFECAMGERAFAASAMPHAHESLSALSDCVWEYGAYLTHPSQIEASLQQGATWARLLPKCQWPTELPSYAVPMIGAFAYDCGLTAAQVRSHLLHTAIRDQVSACIRLGLLGPSQAQALQTEILTEPWSSQKDKSKGEWPLETAPTLPARLSPLLDLALGLHPQLYSRLFQN